MCRLADIGRTVFSQVSVIATAEKNLSAMSLTTVNSFLVVSLTPEINVLVISDGQNVSAKL
jgi:hypothetical protein